MKLSSCLKIGLYLRDDGGDGDYAGSGDDDVVDDDGAVHLGPHELVLLLDLLDHLLLHAGEVACLQDKTWCFYCTIIMLTETMRTLSIYLCK